MDLVAVGTAEVLGQVVGRQIDLAEQEGVAASPGDERPQVAEEVVWVERNVAGDPAGLQQERDGVHAKAIDAELEPEADDLGDLVAHSRVADVEVGLM